MNTLNYLLSYEQTRHLGEGICSLHLLHLSVTIYPENIYIQTYV